MSSVALYFTSHKHIFLKPFLLLLATVILLEFAGSYFDLFQYHSLAYDKVLHFLGGVTCGIFGIALLSIGFWDSPCDRTTANRRILIMALLAALIIGIGWEKLQAMWPALRDASDYDWYDTMGDVVFDTMGGAIAACWYRLRA